MRFKTKPASVMPALTMEGNVDRIHQQLIRCVWCTQQVPHKHLNGWTVADTVAHTHFMPLVLFRAAHCGVIGFVVGKR